MATKKKTKAAEVFKGDTHIGVVLDRSGSMHEIEDEVVSGFNAWRADLLDSAANLPGKTFVTLNQFDNIFETVVDNVKAIGLPKLTLMIPTEGEHRFQPRSTTALLDAVGRTIVMLDEKQNPKDRFLLVVMTDGKENSSREYNYDRVQSMIADRKKIGNWTVVFLGSEIEKNDATNRMIVHTSGVGNTQTYDPSVKGATAQVLRSASLGTTNYMNSTLSATENFMPGDAEPTIPTGKVTPTSTTKITPKRPKRKA